MVKMMTSCLIILISLFRILTMKKKKAMKQESTKSSSKQENLLISSFFSHLKTSEITGLKFLFSSKDMEK